MTDARTVVADVPPLPERRFGESDMFVPHDEDPRSSVPTSGERATLVDYLGAYRQTLELKCRDLDAEQLARRSVPPSNLSLLGLLRHLADAERFWFRKVLAGDDAPPMFRTDENRDAAFDGAVGEAEGVEEAWEAWRGEVAFAERFVEDAPSLGITGTLRRPPEAPSNSTDHAPHAVVADWRRLPGLPALVRRFEW